MNLHLTPMEILAGVGALIVLVAAWRASVRTTRRVAEAARAGVRLMSLAGRVVVSAALITGVQWLVLTHAATNVTLMAVTLGLPALLAGHTLTRALTATTSELPRRRGGVR